MNLKQFYDDNENGGSSRWLVAPNVVENFVKAKLKESLERVRLEEAREGKFKCDCWGFEECCCYLKEVGYNQAVSDLKKKRDTELKRIEEVKK